MMKTSAFLVYVALGTALSATAAQAANPAAGKAKYEATCVACHGMSGISIAPIYPNLAGQKQAYLVAQLKAFRDGDRKNPIMQPMAEGLSDTDIANIAAYVATLKP